MTREATPLPSIGRHVAILLAALLLSDAIAVTVLLVTVFAGAFGSIDMLFGQGILFLGGAALAVGITSRMLDESPHTEQGWRRDFLAATAGCAAYPLLSLPMLETMPGSFLIFAIVVLCTLLGALFGGLHRFLLERYG